MTGPEIVERVASQIDFSGLDVHKIARTAILALLDAIREPSEARIRTGHEAYCADDSEDVEGGISAVWMAMIDALRKEITG